MNNQVNQKRLEKLFNSPEFYERAAKAVDDWPEDENCSDTYITPCGCG